MLGALHCGAWTTTRGKTNTGENTKEEMAVQDIKLEVMIMEEKMLEEITKERKKRKASEW